MKNFCVFFLFLVNLFCAGAQQELSISIELYDQKIYFLGDDIQIRVSVKNIATMKAQFLVADRKVFSLDFIVSTTANRPMNIHSEMFKNERNSSLPVLYRDVSLAPGEEYSFIVNLNDFVTLTAPGVYMLQGKFFGSLYINDDSLSNLSNKITVNIRPAADSTEQRSEREAEITREMQREKLSPDQVVSFMLHARQENHWPKFFLYINLEKLYLNHYLVTRENQDQFYRLSEEQRRTRIAQYKNRIVESKEEWEFMLMTHDFKIIKTEYSRFNATVVVNQVFKHPDYNEYRRYTYSLSRANPTNTWEIVNYFVENDDSAGR